MTTNRCVTVPIIAALLGACSAGEDTYTVDVKEEAVIVPSWEAYKEQAVRTEDGLYVVEWDLVFANEEALRTHYDQTVIAEREKLAVFQQISTGFEPTFQGSDALEVIYCVSTSFSNQATVIADLADATRDWEDVINVNFRYDASQNSNCTQNNNNVDFAVLPTTQSGLMGCGASKLLWPAVGGCPVGGSTVRGVLLMQYGIIPGSGAWSGVTPTGVLRHELGHILGFRHEHPWAPSQGGCSEAPTISGIDTTGRRLTDYDQLSVMHYPSCAGISGADQTISALDGVGARSVYGMPAAWYVGISI